MLSIEKTNECYEHIPLPIRDRLFNYQKEGVLRCIAKHGRLIIGDEMGLGKTLQAISVIQAFDEYPLLVICPASLVGTWYKEIYKWITITNYSEKRVVHRPQIYMNPSKSNPLSSIVIVSYDLFSRHAHDFARHQFKFLVCDEAHYLKNHTSKRSIAVSNLSKSITHILLLTGTPALSRPIELYMLLYMLDRVRWKSMHEFGVKYCDGQHNFFGWDYTGASNIDELRAIVCDHFMIRRLKADVLTELPPKIRRETFLDGAYVSLDRFYSLCREYNQKRTALLRNQVRTCMMECYMLTAQLKIKLLCKYLSDNEEKLLAHRRLIVFAHHHSILNAVQKHFEEKLNTPTVRIDGTTEKLKRQEIVDRFQSDKDERLVAILAITAAGSGLQLSNAHYTLFAELYWTPGAHWQCEDRTHRIGQKHVCVHEYLIADGTFDNYLWKMIHDKDRLLTSLFDEKSIDNDNDTTTTNDNQPTNDDNDIDTFINVVIDSTNNNIEESSSSTTSTTTTIVPQSIIPDRPDTESECSDIEKPIHLVMGNKPKTIRKRFRRIQSSEKIVYTPKRQKSLMLLENEYAENTKENESMKVVGRLRPKAIDNEYS